MRKNAVCHEGAEDMAGWGILWGPSHIVLELNSLPNHLLSGLMTKGQDAMRDLKRCFRGLNEMLYAHNACLPPTKSSVSACGIALTS